MGVNLLMGCAEPVLNIALQAGLFFRGEALGIEPQSVVEVHCILQPRYRCFRLFPPEAPEPAPVGFPFLADKSHLLQTALDQIEIGFHLPVKLLGGRSQPLSHQILRQAGPGIDAPDQKQNGRNEQVDEIHLKRPVLHTPADI